MVHLWQQAGHSRPLLNELQNTLLPRCFEKESVPVALLALDCIRTVPLDVFALTLLKSGREKAILTACSEEQSPAVRITAIDTLIQVRVERTVPFYSAFTSSSLLDVHPPS